MSIDGGILLPVVEVEDVFVVEVGRRWDGSSVMSQDLKAGTDEWSHEA
jgi:hypothetical protein